MTLPFPNRKLLKSGTACSRIAAGAWHLGAVDEQLMPFGRAAKAIFVKANGLAAYYSSSSGTPRYAAPGKN